MTAYILANIDVIDPDGFREYGELAYPTLLAAGGRILAASEKGEIVEGEWQPGVIVLAEFPSVEEARRWLESSAYRPARQLRQRTTHTDMILIDA